MLNRRQARENAFLLIFGNAVVSADPASYYEDVLDAAEDGAEGAILPDDYTRDVFFGVSEKREELDAYITRFAQGWDLSRISGVSLAVMRLSIYEMLCRADVPGTVSLNEAIELVKKYDDEGARAFVNGVLNAALKEIRPEKANT